MHYLFERDVPLKKEKKMISEKKTRVPFFTFSFSTELKKTNNKQGRVLGRGGQEKKTQRAVIVFKGRPTDHHAHANPLPPTA